MKEVRFFYVPDINSAELPTDEAAHCLRVLRLAAGATIFLTDGKGKIYQAHIIDTTNKHCRFQVTDELIWNKPWRGNIHVAVAPTKNISRTEWLVEKAVEIGIDEISFLASTNSERRAKINMDRMKKIAVAAMKQSHKAMLPQLNNLTPFASLLETAPEPQKFIAHCFDEADIDAPNLDTTENNHEANPFLSHTNENFSRLNGIRSEKNKVMAGEKPTISATLPEKPYLLDADTGEDDTLVLIGPEGDFTISEVREALSHGYRAVSLGESRLRTETAALVAAHLVHIKHSA